MFFKEIGGIIIIACMLNQLGIENSVAVYALLSAISSLIILTNGRVTLKNNFLVLMVSVGLATVLFFSYSYYSIVFLLIYLVLFLLLSLKIELVKKDMKHLNILLVLTFILAMVPVELRFYFSIVDFLTTGITSWENNIHPWLFLLFFTYFYQLGEKKYTFLNLVFLFISFKRIVILGVVAFVFYDIFKSRSKLLQNIVTIPLLLLPFIPWLLTNRRVSDYVYSKTGLYISHITQGRSSYFEIILKEYKLSLFPVGLGKVTEFSVDKFNFLIHNDHLKLLLEIGIPLYVVAILILKKALPLPYFALLMLLMATDNVLIYFYFLFFFFVVARSSVEIKSKDLCYS